MKAAFALIALVVLALVALVVTAITWPRRVRARRLAASRALLPHAAWVAERVDLSGVERHFTSTSFPTQRSAS